MDEVTKITNSELLSRFVSGTQGIFISDDLKLKFTGSNRKVYYKNVVVATLDYEGKVLTAKIDRSFLFFPELDTLLCDLGFFLLRISPKLVSYSSYTPKGYRAQYTLPNVLWKAWILSRSNDKEKILLLHEQEWLTIEDLSFNGSQYLVSLIGRKNSVELGASKILWGDRKPATTLQIWSSTTKSYTTVPIFRSSQIPSILEIERDSMISIEDFWKVVRIFHDKLEAIDLKLLTLSADYNNAKSVVLKQETDIVALRKKESASIEAKAKLEKIIAQKDAQIVLHKESVEMYQNAINANNISLAVQKR